MLQLLTKVFGSRNERPVRSYGKLVAILAARTGDVAGAEDALSEAFAAALEQWPARGEPSNPEAWLLTVARRRQVDSLRQKRLDDDLTDLARHSRRTGRWDALVTVKPLHLTGGVGSPANATAIR